MRNEANWQKAKWRRKRVSRQEKKKQRTQKTQRRIERRETKDTKRDPPSGHQPMYPIYIFREKLRIWGTFPRLHFGLWWGFCGLVLCINSPHQPIDRVAQIFRNSLQFDGCFCCCLLIFQSFSPAEGANAHTRTRETYTHTRRRVVGRTHAHTHHRHQDVEITGRANRHFYFCQSIFGWFVLKLCTSNFFPASSSLVCALCWVPLSMRVDYNR